MYRILIQNHGIEGRVFPWDLQLCRYYSLGHQSQFFLVATKGLMMSAHTCKNHTANSYKNRTVTMRNVKQVRRYLAVLLC